MKTQDDILNKPKPLNRRRFLGLGAAALALPFLGRLTAFASPSALDAPLPLDRGLSFYNTHTAETADLEYCQSGCLVPESHQEDQPHPQGHPHGRCQGHRRPSPRPAQHPGPEAPDERALPHHLRLPLARHERLPADARRRRGRLQQPPSRRQGHRYPRPGRQAPGPLQSRRRPEGRRGGDLSRIGFRPRRRRPRPDLVSPPTRRRPTHAPRAPCRGPRP